MEKDIGMILLDFPDEVERLVRRQNPWLCAYVIHVDLPSW
jgi:hypothetical protein